MLLQSLVNQLVTKGNITFVFGEVFYFKIKFVTLSA